MKKNIRVALPKGRLGDKVYEIMEKAGEIASVPAEQGMPDADENGNILFEGENLDLLKALAASGEKIQMIYISMEVIIR